MVGLMPYEKRILDVLKAGGAASEKKVYKFAKRRVRSFLFLLFFLPRACVCVCVGGVELGTGRCGCCGGCVSCRILSVAGLVDRLIHTHPQITQLGTHRRALRKREEIKEYYSKLRARQAAH